MLGLCVVHTSVVGASPSTAWDKESPGEPARISRNYLGKSFHEACAVQSEPIGVSAENFELLQDEIEQLQKNSYLDDTSQALPYVEPDNMGQPMLRNLGTRCCTTG